MSEETPAPSKTHVPSDIPIFRRTLGAVNRGEALPGGKPGKPQPVLKGSTFPLSAFYVLVPLRTTNGLRVSAELSGVRVLSHHGSPS